MPLLQIRPLQANDFDDWLHLWLAYQTFYRVDIPADTSRIVWRRLLDPAEPMHGALAVRDAKPVGLVHRITHRTCWAAADDCYLQDLFVAASVRGQGVGRRLIEHVYEAAAAQGCARVYWLTHETNATAMTLYDRISERSGFLEYSKALAGSNPNG
jgi:GNAT superfamily N-acetyltransferase